MLRTLILCALLGLGTSSQGQEDRKPNEVLVELTVPPMPAPKPALRYRLLPELKEMNPGNPIPNYLRCMMEQDLSSETEVRSNSVLRQVDRAARLDKPDWQILLQVKTEGISLRLPDLQKVRTLASALQERFRAEVALRCFDDGLITAKTLFAMSRHMGENPTLIADLVGIAIATVAI